MNKTTKLILALLVLIIIVVLGVYWYLHAHRVSTLSKDAAVALIQKDHIDLAQYGLSTLPTSSIETSLLGDVWLVGFVQKDTMTGGIATARCYSVTNNGVVTVAGEYSEQSGEVVMDLNLKDCSPSSNQIATTTSSTGAHPPIPAPPSTTPPSSTSHEYGTPVTLALNEHAQFKDVRVTPLSVVSDNRCATGVTCIQAGTVQLNIQLVSGSGTITTEVITLGKATTVNDDTYTLTSVAPSPVAGHPIVPSTYRFTILVTKSATVAACHIGGCSSELCSDSADAVSTCVYRSSFACYKTATCERQPTGQCGWTPTTQLKTCLAHNS